MTTIRDLIDDATDEVTDLMLAPCVDPGAPAGYVRPAWFAAELCRRTAAARAVYERLCRDIERHYGPGPAATAREHFAGVLAELGAARVH